MKLHKIKKQTTQIDADACTKRRAMIFDFRMNDYCNTKNRQNNQKYFINIHQDREPVLDLHSVHFGNHVTAAKVE